MTEAVKNLAKDVAVERSGATHKIIIPEKMTLDEAAKWLIKEKERQETTVAVRRNFKAYVLDGAYAFAKAIAHECGFAQQIPTPGMFGSKPPGMISIEIAYGQHVEVPWGRVAIPGVTGYLNTGFEHDENGLPYFIAAGEIKEKDRELVKKIFDRTEIYLATESIYKGKALSIRFRDDMGNPFEEFSPTQAPQFMNATVQKTDLIFDEITKAEIESYIFTPIEHAAAARELGVPIKRGVLLHGTFGVGKTMIGAVLANICQKHGITFIDLQDVRDIHRAIHMALRYGPSLVWAEDIDKAVGLARDSSVDQILNTIDGVGSKGHQLIICVTTNDIEKINAALLRPGRFDAIIGINPPDADAALQLVYKYGRGKVEVGGERIEEVGKMLAGKIPAMIRECVERAKLNALSRNNGDVNITIRDEDLIVSATSLNKHLEAMLPKEKRERIPMAFVMGEDAVKGEFFADHK